MQLLQETVSALKANGKHIKDVRWCEQDDCYFSWEDFKKLADLDYDERSGKQLIASDLRIYGDDFWLERYEFDGTEGWSFVSVSPEKPLDYKAPSSLITI